MSRPCEAPHQNGAGDPAFQDGERQGPMKSRGKHVRRLSHGENSRTRATGLSPSTCSPTQSNRTIGAGLPLPPLPNPRAGDFPVTSLCLCPCGPERCLGAEPRRTAEGAWLGGVSASMLQQSVRDLDQAFRNGWLRQATPVLLASRRRHNHQSIPICGKAFRTTGQGVRFPKTGQLRGC